MSRDTHKQKEGSQKVSKTIEEIKKDATIEIIGVTEPAVSGGFYCSHCKAYVRGSSFADMTTCYSSRYCPSCGRRVSDEA